MTSVDPLVAHLVEARKKAGLSQAKVAGTVGFSCATSGRLSEYETGRREPSLATLRRWAQILGFEPAWVPVAYETAPVVELAAGNGVTEGGTKPQPDAPASAPVPVVTGDRADVAHAATEDPTGRALWCSCGSWSMLYRNSFGLDAYEAHAEHVAKMRTLDVAERTAEKAREARGPVTKAEIQAFFSVEEEALDQIYREKYAEKAREARQ